MSEIFTAVKSAPTTTPRETYVEVTHSLTDGVLVYRPGDNSFIALYLDEWLVCRADGYKNKTAIEELQEANREVTAKSLALRELLEQPNAARAAIAQARKELDAALNTLSQKSDAAKERVQALDSQKVNPGKLVELVPMTMKRLEGRSSTPIYVNVNTLRGALADRRVYVVEGSAERNKPPKQKLFNGTTLNVTEIRNRIQNQVQDKAKFSKKWKWAPQDADQFSGILTDWAKVMGSDLTSWLERSQKQVLDGFFRPFGYKPDNDPNDPRRMIDTKAEAQFMRWVAGASAEAIFMPFQGNLNDARDTNWKQRIARGAKSAQFSVKANAEASFAIGEAKIEATLYLPHAAGWHLDGDLAGQQLDFGYFRMRGDLTFSALAGASIALEASAALMITGQQQGIRGTPRHGANIGVGTGTRRWATARVGAKGSADIFAGIKETIGLAGALQWLNPEGLISPTGPKKPDPNKAIAAYADVAKVSGDVSAIQGLAATLGFECAYRNGRFVIAAKAGACLGLGGSVSGAYEVSAEQIGQFFMCIAHQLKQADYRKLVPMMPEPAFKVLNQIFYLNVVIGREIESFVGLADKQIKTLYERAVASVNNDGELFLRRMAEKLKSGWGWFSYTPPESRAALIKSVVDAFNQSAYVNNRDLKQLAAFLINELFSTVQTSRHLANTLDRMTYDLGSESGQDGGVRLISSIVADTRFANCIERCSRQVAQSSPLLGRAFLRNDEPDFHLAKFPLHHSGYSLG